MVLAVLVIFFVAFFWNIEPAVSVASQAPYAPSDAWVSSLYWLKENTPEPFGDPDFYYRLERSGKYSSLSALKQAYPDHADDLDFYQKLEAYYPYPESAYGVLAWWDYGYWITRIAHRLPNAHPGQDPRAITSVASFFISQDEKTANEIAGELDTSYVIIDNATAYIDPVTTSGKFWAIVTWAGNYPTDYFDGYLVPQQDQQSGKTVYTQDLLYYPEYYRSLAVRLYNFDGKAVTPESVLVISYEERLADTGKLYKVLTGAEEFGTYEEAETYLNNQEATNLRIVSTDPMLSPAPLEEVEHYELIHSSNSTVTLRDASTVPEVKIFQYKD